MKTNYAQVTNICLQFFFFTQITLDSYTKSIYFINYLWASVFFRVEKKKLFLETNLVELTVH